MSVIINVSNTTDDRCREIINKLLQVNINDWTIETVSTLDGNIEKGYSITLGKDYIDKKLKKFKK